MGNRVPSILPEGGPLMYRKTLTLALALGLCASLIAATASAATTTYNVDNTHSSVTFKIRHLVSKVAGRCDKVSGTIVADRADLTKSTVELTIDATSIDTDNENRDGHLKSPDFFDTEKFPTITFKSTKVEKTGENTYGVTGDFTMRGVTKSMVIPVTVLGISDGAQGSMAGFETTFPLNRKEFGVEWNKALDAGGFVLGDEVDVNILLEAREPKKE